MKERQAKIIAKMLMDGEPHDVIEAFIKTEDYFNRTCFNVWRPVNGGFYILNQPNMSSAYTSTN